MYPTPQVSLVFSFLSTLFTSITLVCVATWLPMNKIGLRWKLILNLLISELLNASNNSISGIYGVLNELTDGPGCKANGFIGQLTVQAADFSTLAIALVTFITLINSSPDSNSKLEGLTVIISSIIWIFPLCTAIAGFAWVGYSKVSPNWCWLAENSLARYVLTHGPRIFIFSTIIILYGIIAVKLISAAKKTNNDQFETETLERGKKNSKRKIYHATLRLMSFPIVYIILWAPGMINRLFEAILPKDDPKRQLTVFLQSFTQLLGFADSILTLWNLRVIQQSENQE